MLGKMKLLTLLSLVGYVMSAEWSYADFGKEMWKEDYPTCAGQRQSPINIPPADSDHLTYENLGTITFNGYNNTGATSLSMQNNGHTAVVTIDNNQGTTYIEGGGLSGKYIALQFHFHWGPDDHHGSEHTFRGKMYPLELHIVHFKESYGNVATALGNGDGAAVIGVFFEISEADNPDLNPVINNLEQIRNKDASVSVSLNFENFLGAKTSEFYRYLGSLTTPGCNEAVIWTVLEGKNYISSSQLAKFRSLYSSSSNTPLTINYRPTQPLFGRNVIKNYQGNLPADYHWGYGHDSEGPNDWQYYYPTCSGQRQSPINIPPLYDSRVNFDATKNLDTLEFINYDQPITGKIKNNGHTVQVDIESPNIYIMNGGLTGMYRAAQFHFHWGTGNNQGSEHTINNNAFPLELHIVHYKVEYETISEALKRDDGLAVVGFLYQVQDSNNANYDTVINKLSEVKFKDQMANINGFSLEHLTLSNLRKNASSGIHYPFYRYVGGLTTPPCSQVVIWTVMNEPVHLSSAQIGQFRNLAHITSTTAALDAHDLIAENFRPVQPLLHRQVYISSQGLVGAPGTSPPVGFKWSYHGDSGPQNWKAYYPTCEGERQSPIDIPSSRSDKLVYDPTMGLDDLEFVNYASAITGTIKNNGHTVQVDIESPRIYIRKGGLDGTYRAVQFHFHWGPDNQHGSEHTVNGRSYPLELHIVHFKESYGSVSAAAKQADGLAVVGFFFSVSPSANTAYSDMVSNLMDVKYKGASKAISGFDLQSLTIKELRQNASGFHNPFYRYMGGLTTPPCSQVVTWTVMHQHIGMSAAQLAEFRKVLHVTEPESHTGNADDLYITENYRPVQNLAQRVVYTSYPPMTDTSGASSLHSCIMVLALLFLVVACFR